MPRATLIVNPAAGRARLLDALYPALERRFVERGFAVTIAGTTAEAGSAGRLAAEAAARYGRGDVVMACGGDGTVHAAVQGLAGTDVPLGVLPLGTHNGLARGLGLPRDPLAALAMLLRWEPRLISLGEIRTATETRVFALMAGCGPAGALAARLAEASRAKRMLGRHAYALHAAWLLWTRRWPAFEVRYRLPGSPAWQTVEATSLLVSRVPSLGGVFGGLTPRAAPGNAHLQVHLLRGPAHLAMPAWLARVPNPWLVTLDVEELHCTAVGAARAALVQADAEPLGGLPCSLRVRAGALRLLMPPVDSPGVSL